MQFCYTIFIHTHIKALWKKKHLARIPALHLDKSFHYVPVTYKHRPYGVGNSGETAGLKCRVCPAATGNCQTFNGQERFYIYLLGRKQGFWYSFYHKFTGALHGKRLKSLLFPGHVRAVVIMY